MLPSGHIGAAYLVYALFRRLVDWPAPDRLTLGAIIVGGLFADLVDKPLAWELGVLAAGRSLAHSLLTASIVIAVVMLVAINYDRLEPGIAFSLGHLSHIVTDGYTPLLQDGSTEFILWPLGPYQIWDGGLWVPPQYATELNWGVLAVAVLVWIYDGMPGLRSSSANSPADSGES